jgi:SprT protein
MIAMNGLHLLEPHLPEGAIALAAKWFDTPNLTVKLVSGRKYRLGSYRHHMDGRHFISLSVDQDCYTLLITMAHEVAHMQALQEWGRKIAPHGSEWQSKCRELLLEAAQLPSLPQDIRTSILMVAKAPGGTHLNHPGVAETFMKYNSRYTGMKLLHQLPENSRFALSDGRIFIKGIKKRTRYVCLAEWDQRNYMVSGSAPVTEIDAAT